MKSLETIIEEEVGLAVERIMRASRDAALVAFEKRFSLTGTGAGGQRESSLGTATTARPTAPRKKPSASHRSEEEIAALEERFLATVRSNPGEPMTVLAPKAGVTAAELRVPVVRLKKKRKVKLVGPRHLACYFPVDADIAA
jgi:hypothetical protein